MAGRMGFSGVVLFLLVFAAALGAYVVIRYGVSARDQPTQAEIFVARRLRHLAIPLGARQMSSPEPATPETIDAGLEHFADHCSICHGNDGSGDTEIGRNLYPKAPDMRREETQALSDGELFYIIENGIRFTGMPAWSTGKAESAHDTWALVHFIRHVPKLTDAELAKMRGLNPKSPEELEQEQQIQEFLEGGEKPQPPVESGKSDKADKSDKAEKHQHPHH